MVCHTKYIKYLPILKYRMILTFVTREAYFQMFHKKKQFVHSLIKNKICYLQSTNLLKIHLYIFIQNSETFSLMNYEINCKFNI